MQAITSLWLEDSCVGYHITATEKEEKPVPGQNSCSDAGLIFQIMGISLLVSHYFALANPTRRMENTWHEKRRTEAKTQFDILRVEYVLSYMWES